MLCKNSMSRTFDRERFDRVIAGLIGGVNIWKISTDENLSVMTINNYILRATKENLLERKHQIKYLPTKYYTNYLAKRNEERE